MRSPLRRTPILGISALAPTPTPADGGSGDMERAKSACAPHAFSTTVATDITREHGLPLHAQHACLVPCGEEELRTKQREQGHLRRARIEARKQHKHAEAENELVHRAWGVLRTSVHAYCHYQCAHARLGQCDTASDVDGQRVPQMQNPLSLGPLCSKNCIFYFSFKISLSSICSHL